MRLLLHQAARRQQQPEASKGYYRYILGTATRGEDERRGALDSLRPTTWKNAREAQFIHSERPRPPRGRATGSSTARSPFVQGTLRIASACFDRRSVKHSRNLPQSDMRACVLSNPSPDRHHTHHTLQRERSARPTTTGSSSKPQCRRRPRARWAWTRTGRRAGLLLGPAPGLRARQRLGALVGGWGHHASFKMDGMRTCVKLGLRMCACVCGGRPILSALPPQSTSFAQPRPQTQPTIQRRASRSRSGTP